MLHAATGIVGDRPFDQAFGNCGMKVVIPEGGTVFAPEAEVGPGREEARHYPGAGSDLEIEADEIRTGRIQGAAPG